MRIIPCCTLLPNESYFLFFVFSLRIYDIVYYIYISFAVALTLSRFRFLFFLLVYLQYKLPQSTVFNIGGHQTSSCSLVVNQGLSCFEGNLDTQYISGIAQVGPSTTRDSLDVFFVQPYWLSHCRKITTALSLDKIEHIKSWLITEVLILLFNSTFSLPFTSILSPRM